MTEELSSLASSWPEKECRALLMSAPWPIFIWKPETGAILEANHAAARRYGYRIEDFARLGVSDIVSARARPALAQLTQYGQHSPPAELLSEHVNSAGETFPVEVISFSLWWQGQAARFSLIRDRRPHVDLTGDRSYFVNLENMARVSSAIAHNFNQLLTMIQMAAEQLQEAVPVHAVQQAEFICNTARSASSLVQQLLHFGHRHPGRMVATDLSAWTYDVQDILRAALGDEIVLELHLTHGCQAMVNVDQIREALLNLAVNAREAMGSGGTCILTVAREHLMYPKLGLDLEPGDYVVISLRDTGCGMSGETLAHALEPYYSTKPRGHGLGLSSVYGIMRLHRGNIEILSSEGQGTTVALYFPMSPDSEVAEAEGEDHREL